MRFGLVPRRSAPSILGSVDWPGRKLHTTNPSTSAPAVSLSLSSPPRAYSPSRLATPRVPSIYNKYLSTLCFRDLRSMRHSDKGRLLYKPNQVIDLIKTNPLSLFRLADGTVTTIQPATVEAVSIAEVPGPLGTRPSTDHPNTDYRTSEADYSKSVSPEPALSGSLRQASSAKYCLCFCTKYTARQCETPKQTTTYPDQVTIVGL